MTAALSRMTHSLSSMPFLTLSSTHQPNCLDPPLIAASCLPLLYGKVVASSGLAALFTSHRGENVQSSRANVLREFLAFSCSVLVAWLGVGFLGEREEEPGGNRLPTQQLTPPLISISSYCHKPNCLTFQHGSHINRAFLVVSRGLPMFASKEQLVMAKMWL